MAKDINKILNPEFIERLGETPSKETEIVWESTGKRNGVPYLTVKKVGSYTFSERLGTDSVAFILFDRKDDKVCIVKERKPPLDERLGTDILLATAFGGSLDSEHTPEQIVAFEVEEEAGYKVDLDRVMYIDSVMVSTQSNQMCYLYLVDVTGLHEQDKKPENELEAMAKTMWIDVDEVFATNDWKCATIVGKAKYQRLM